MAEKIYTDTGSVEVGTKTSTFMTADTASVNDNRIEQNEGSYEMPEPMNKLSSFSVYWDSVDRKFKVYNPIVVDPAGNEIEVPQPTMSAGTFVCEVKYDSNEDGYVAAFKLSTAVVPSADTVTVVKIFKLLNGEIEQYHTGAIVLDTDITGEQGVESVDDAQKLHGSVSMSGSTGSGLVVKSFGQNGEKKLEIDLSARDDDDEFGIHDVTENGIPNGKKVFSTDDIEVGSSEETDEVEVVTGFSLIVDGSTLKITWNKKKICKVKVEDVQDAEEELLTLQSLDAVVDVEYTSPNLKQQKQTIYGFSTDQAQAPETIFTATAHSQV